jgi:hypothetical protein
VRTPSSSFRTDDSSLSHRLRRRRGKDVRAPARARRGTPPPPTSSSSGRAQGATRTCLLRLPRDRPNPDGRRTIAVGARAAGVEMGRARSRLRGVPRTRRTARRRRSRRSPSKASVKMPRGSGSQSVDACAACHGLRDVLVSPFSTSPAHRYGEPLTAAADPLLSVPSNSEFRIHSSPICALRPTNKRRSRFRNRDARAREVLLRRLSRRPLGRARSDGVGARRREAPCAPPVTPAIVAKAPLHAQHATGRRADAASTATWLRSCAARARRRARSFHGASHRRSRASPGRVRRMPCWREERRAGRRSRGSAGRRAVPPSAGSRWPRPSIAAALDRPTGSASASLARLAADARARVVHSLGADSNARHGPSRPGEARRARPGQAKR